MKIIKHKTDNKKQRKLFNGLITEYPSQRFVPYKKGYLDMTTGLLWEKYQDVETYTFEEAMKIKRGKYKLPTIEQLETLIDKSIRTSSTKLPDMLATNYWSSSTYVGLTFSAWNASFDNVGANYAHKINSFYVRCVKPGPLSIIYRGVRINEN